MAHISWHGHPPKRARRAPFRRGGGERPLFASCLNDRSAFDVGRIASPAGYRFCSRSRDWNGDTIGRGSHKYKRTFKLLDSEHHALNA
jgi:hypothetical protein